MEINNPRHVLYQSQNYYIKTHLLLWLCRCRWVKTASSSARTQTAKSGTNIEAVNISILIKLNTLRTKEQKNPLFHFDSLLACLAWFDSTLLIRTICWRDSKRNSVFFISICIFFVLYIEILLVHCKNIETACNINNIHITCNGNEHGKNLTTFPQFTVESCVSL